MKKWKTDIIQLLRVYIRVGIGMFFFFILMSSYRSTAQITNQVDSVKFKKLNISQNKFINNIFQQARNSVEKSKGGQQDFKFLNKKSETPFLPYQGKIIRRINVNPFNFDRKISDTGRQQDNSRAARIGKRFHYVTKEFVIKDNLFIKENTPLNAFKVADNERFLRSLEYIHDARILVLSLKNNPDSVDIDIYTIDLFSIAGGFSSNGLNHLNTDIFENNLYGMGQKVEVTNLYDYNRSPQSAYGIMYRKNNVAHTFVDATVGLSTMGGNPFTNEEESSEYFTLNRQLVSPYSRVAGGLTISHNEAYNIYHVPDVNFYKYSYNLFDVWGGYNVGIKKLTKDVNTIRDRRFWAIRYFNRDFNVLPKQVTTYNPVFNSSSAVLSQITFFRQDYYRTQYIYGFGTTEDLPYGYDINATIGWQKQLDLNRFYSGINCSDYISSTHGDFIQFYLKAGGFVYKNQMQDQTFLAGVTAFSRLFFWNSTKMRQFLNVNYSQINNVVTYAPLRIDNYYGVRGFLSDSVTGVKRFSVQSETEFFLKFKFWGFHFAPFPYMDFSVLIPPGQGGQKASLYSSLGGGVRMRNENLVFETIELRAYFFPVAPNNMKGFKIVLNSNIRYRYTSNFITAPDFVQLNSQ